MVLVVSPTPVVKEFNKVKKCLNFFQLLGFRTFILDPWTPNDKRKLNVKFISDSVQC